MDEISLGARAIGKIYPGCPHGIVIAKDLYKIIISWTIGGKEYNYSYSWREAERYIDFLLIDCPICKSKFSLINDYICPSCRLAYDL
jgi:hypothetical protein